MKDISKQNPMDLALALDRVGGDGELLNEIAGLFLEQVPDSMAAIRKAVETRDSTQVQREAHRLKGSIGNFAAKSAHDAALKLEMQAREGKLSALPNAYSVLEKEMERLVAALASLDIPEAGS